MLVGLSALVGDGSAAANTLSWGGDGFRGLITGGWCNTRYEVAYKGRRVRREEGAQKGDSNLHEIAVAVVRGAIHGCCCTHISRRICVHERGVIFPAKTRKRARHGGGSGTRYDRTLGTGFLAAFKPSIRSMIKKKSSVCTDFLATAAYSHPLALLWPRGFSSPTFSRSFLLAPSLIAPSPCLVPCSSPSLPNTLSSPLTPFLQLLPGLPPFHLHPFFHPPYYPPTPI